MSMVRSASTVKSDACIGFQLENLFAKGFDVQGTAVEIDVAAVGLVRDGDDFGAGFAKECGGESGCRAVAAIDDDLSAG